MFGAEATTGGPVVNPRAMGAIYRISFTSVAVRDHILHSGGVRNVKELAMLVGVPREVKNNEYRVALTPSGVHELVRHGHEVYLEREAGVGSAISDGDFVSAGAQILPTADDVWATADMVLKVKEPIAEEYHRMRKDQILFTYLHLAADKACTDALLAAGTTGIAYETVQLEDGSLPLLAPMSEVAGRLAPQVGSYHLMRQGGGRGTLMGGVPGVYAAKVVVIGAGVSGQNAAAIALGMQAEVLLLDKNVARLRQVDAIYQGHCQTVASNAYEIERAVLDADLVIGAVLIPGAKAPKLVTNELVSRMKSGSVLVDISIDQGGCFEDSRPTTHAEPTYQVHNSVFYCVANMPGAVPHTSTYALTNVTLPYAIELANRGWREALRRDPALALGLNTHEGQLTNAPVAEAHGYESVNLVDVLA
jgi:alanine dehydrogenase